MESFMDKIISLAALATLIGFLLILALHAPSLDLVIVIVIVASLASYDSFTSAWTKKD
jgi:hypothetical protein